MQNPMYVSIEAETRGLLTNGCNTEASIGVSAQTPYSDESTVKGYSHNITIPRDPLSGQPSGQRIHSPFVITKLLDKSSPLLMGALVDGEKLRRVTLRKYRTGSDGKLELFYTITLEDAIVLDINPDAPHTFGELEKDVAPLEHVSFSYRKIIWNHVLAGTEAEDDWRLGVGA